MDLRKLISIPCDQIQLIEPGEAMEVPRAGLAPLGSFNRLMLSFGRLVRRVDSR
jgi:hypothetical protein